MKYICFNCLGKGGGFVVRDPSSFPEAVPCYVCHGIGHIYTPALAKRLGCAASSLYAIEYVARGRRPSRGAGKVAARILPQILFLAEQERLCVEARDRRAVARAS